MSQHKLTFLVQAGLLLFVLIGCVGCDGTPTPTPPATTPAPTAPVPTPTEVPPLSTPTPTQISTPGPTPTPTGTSTPGPTPMLTVTIPVPTHTPIPTDTIQATYEMTSTWRCGSVADISLVDEKTGWAVVNCIASWPPRQFSKGIIYHLVDGNWQRVEDAPVLGPPYSCYKAISAIGPEEVWAVGLQGGLYGCQFGTWVLHYSNGHWENVNLENKLFTDHATGLLDIDMVDAENGWAVGYGLIFRYKKGQWSIEVDLPIEHINDQRQENPFYAVSMADVNEGWAGGRDGLLFHYERGTWTRWQDSLFESATVMDIHTVRPGEAWAVGTRGSGDSSSVPRIWHYANNKWSETVPQIGQARINSIKMVSPNEGWAIGQCYTECKNGYVILHYTNGHWENIPAPRRDFADLQSVGVAGPDHIWIGGWGFYRYLPPSNWEHIELAPAGVWPHD